MLNVPWATARRCALVGYYDDMPGFIDAHGPGGTLDKDVNSGERTGGRASLRFEPTDNITVTPRVIYQDVKVDGYNREDVWNMLANEFTTTEPVVLIGEREQYRQFPERFDDQFMLSDLDDGVRPGPACC